MVQKQESRSFFFNYKSKLMFGVGTALSFFQTTSAEYNCFEAKDDKDYLGHDYTLNCASSELLTELVTKLKENCGIYNDGYDDCARFFIDILKYGKGFFGGYRCELTHHASIYAPNQCVIDTLTENTPDGYGTQYDIASTVAIVSSLICLAACCRSLVRKYKSQSNNETTKLVEVNVTSNYKTMSV